ncbi:PqiC family protein [Paraglaciecola sp.]|uniref:PqiC family protein n=1 Tax=Paraglaciecola sp. TaxID=1920173 RepID=UPI00326581AC
MIKVFLTTLLSTLLAGCSVTESVPEIQYYLLDAMPTEQEIKLSTKQINIPPIDLPDYLQQPNLVMRGEQQQMHMARYHSWADNLGDSIRRVMAIELSQPTSDTNKANTCSPCVNLYLSIQHFYPTQDGQVILSGEFTIEQSSQMKKHTQPFFFSQPLKASGYGQSVVQMRKMLSLLANQIKEQMVKQVKVEKN